MQHYDFLLLITFTINFSVLNVTGDATTLTEGDYLGPVPIEPIAQTDYYLILSCLVILFSLVYTVAHFKANIIAAYHRLTNLFHFEHPHLD